jgi:hypothetical protein
VPHTVIADNAGGHLMQHGEVDLCIVGSDRTTVELEGGQRRALVARAGLVDEDMDRHAGIVGDVDRGHLMQHGEVDLCIVGSDRTTSTGDVCNKIGTYLKWGTPWALSSKAVSAAPWLRGRVSSTKTWTATPASTRPARATRARR